MSHIALFPLGLLGLIGIAGISLFLWINKKVALFFGAKRFGMGWCLLMWLNVALFSLIAMFLFVFLVNQFDLMLAPVFYTLMMIFLIFPLPAKLILDLPYWHAIGMHILMGLIATLIFGIVCLVAFYCNFSLLTILSEKVNAFKIEVKKSQTIYMETDLKTDPQLVQQVLKVSDALCQCEDDPVCLNQETKTFNKVYLQIEPPKLPGDLKQAVAVAFSHAQSCLSKASTPH